MLSTSSLHLASSIISRNCQKKPRTQRTLSAAGLDLRSLRGGNGRDMGRKREIPLPEACQAVCTEEQQLVKRRSNRLQNTAGFGTGSRACAPARAREGLSSLVQQRCAGRFRGRALFLECKCNTKRKNKKNIRPKKKIFFLAGLFSS